MSGFVLDPQLVRETVFVRDLALTQVRLNNQRDVPWLILVPRVANLMEIYELDSKHRSMLMEEIAQASLVLTKLYAPRKINIGALGNIVAQVHVHVIARYTTDIAWPSAIWGRIKPALYSEKELAETLEKINNSHEWK